MKTIINRLNSYYRGLSANEQKIVDYIKNNFEEVPQLSIYKLSKNVGVSAPTISRFVRNIGYHSYSNFKIELSKANVKSDEEFLFEFSDEDSYSDILKKTFHTNISSLKSTVDLMTKDSLYRAMNILSDANTCSFFGLGGSACIAFYAYHKFLLSPLNAFYNEDFHTQQIFATKMTKNDCAIIISHTGRNKDVLRIAETLKENHVPLIAITSFASSPLAQRADVVLVSVSEEISHRTEALSSVISQISLVESLFMMYSVQFKESSRKSIDKIRKVIEASRLPE